MQNFGNKTIQNFVICRALIAKAWLYRYLSFLKIIKHVIDFRWYKPSENCPNTYVSSMPFCFNMILTSAAVGGPWSFWPFNISCSNCSMDCEEKRRERERD